MIEGDAYEHPTILAQERKLQNLHSIFSPFIFLMFSYYINNRFAVKKF